jgi:polyphosphate kinase
MSKLKNKNNKKSKKKHGQRFFNRELGWLEFNYRVLEEAMDRSHPLLERLKFLAIFGSNLDEFFMLRLPAGASSEANRPPEHSWKHPGLDQEENLALIRQRVIELTEEAGTYFQQTLLGELAQQGIELCRYSELDQAQKAYLRAYFKQQIYPVLTPLAINPGHPFPHISNLSLNLAIVLRDQQGVEQFARLKLPSLLPRLISLELELEVEQGTDESEGKTEDEEAQSEIEEATTTTSYSYEAEELASSQSQNPAYSFVWLEEVVMANLDLLFDGMEVVASYPFRVVRDADLEVAQPEAGDVVEAVEESLQQRRFGPVVHLAVEPRMPATILSLLISNLEITSKEVYLWPEVMGWRDLMQLYNQLELPKLKDPALQPHLPVMLRNVYHQNLFAVIRQQDVLLHHPYDDFSPVVRFLNAAAHDPQVLAIKQTIYRVGPHSPIVEALTRAALKGKQVTVLVEIKARFDEENNLEWARSLERVGANVVFGSIEMKTHCKVTLVVRKEGSVLRRYLHLGTGNYNVKTAALYTDLGLLTSREELGEDASALFNSLTGYAQTHHYHQLLVSPQALRPALLAKIEREIEQAKAGQKAYLFFKMNALTDPECIEALYRASQAGVKVELVVRGSCCLRPGVSGLSENIRVISLVGRFLEHSRIYYFRNGGEENSQELYLGSADLMERNLDRRVETLFPVEDKKLQEYILGEIIPAYLRDNQKARILTAEGKYQRLSPAKDQAPFSAQDYFMTHFQSF